MNVPIYTQFLDLITKLVRKCQAIYQRVAYTQQSIAPYYSATTSYVIGDYFVNNFGRLCKVTKNIPAGDPLIAPPNINANFMYTTVMGEMNS